MLNDKSLELKDIDEEFKFKMKKFSDLFDENLDFYIKQQSKVLDLEKIKDYFNILDIDIKKLEDFSKFIVDINTKYDKDIDIDNINKNILNTSRKIKDNNINLEIKKSMKKNYQF